MRDVPVSVSATVDDKTGEYAIVATPEGLPSVVLFRSPKTPSQKLQAATMPAPHALDGIDLVGKRALEFGPLNRPLVRAEHGAEVFYLDHCTLEELKTKYAGHPGTTVEDLMPVHFIADGRPLAEIVGGTAPFDVLVASHVIEHVPDLIGWLKDAVSVLRVDGTLALVVPDKRFTFDLLRPLATHREIAAAHEQKRSRPGLRCIMDHFANVVEASPDETYHMWDDYSLVKNLPYCHGPEFLELGAREFSAGKYVDVHCWVFTPWSFLSLIGWMCRDHGLDVDLARAGTTQKRNLEFTVHLRRTAGGTKTDWVREASAARDAALWPPNGLEIAHELGLAV